MIVPHLARSLRPGAISPAVKYFTVTLELTSTTHNKAGDLMKNPTQDILGGVFVT
jgi:hypothetical protein